MFGKNNHPTLSSKGNHEHDAQIDTIWVQVSGFKLQDLNPRLRCATAGRLNLEP